MRLWKAIGLVVLVAAVAVLGCFAYGVYHYASVTVPNAYAVNWVAGMVIDYLEAHDGAWPRGWDDLRQPYEVATQRSGRPWSFEQLRARVEVDWDADPAVLADAEPGDDGPPFRVIWLRDGSNVYWESQEPNRMVWAYLRAKRRKSEK